MKSSSSHASDLPQLKKNRGSAQLLTKPKLSINPYADEDEPVCGKFLIDEDKNIMVETPRTELYHGLQRLCKKQMDFHLQKRARSQKRNEVDLQ